MTLFLGKLTNEKVPGIEDLPEYNKLFSELPNRPPRLKEFLEHKNVPKDAIMFASALLQLNPAHRPKAYQALYNSYFANDPQPNKNILQLIPKEIGVAH